MTEPRKSIPVLTEVDGRKVITAEWAVMATPYNPDHTFQSDAVIEVLLEDERTVYVDRHFGTKCDKVFDKAISVHAHWKVHGPSAELKRAADKLAQTQAELVAIKARQEQIRQNRSNGRKKVVAKKAAATTEPKPKPVDHVAAANRLVLVIQDKLDKARTDLIDVTTDVAALVAELAQVTGDPLKTDLTKMTPDEKLALLRQLMN